MESIWDPRRLIEARVDLGLSVKDAAESLGIVPEYLSMLENGHRSASSKLIEKMCGLFSQPAAYFLTEEHRQVET